MLVVSVETMQDTLFCSVVSDLGLNFLLYKCVLYCTLSFTFYAFVLGFISDFDLNTTVFHHYVCLYCLLVFTFFTSTIG